MDGSTELRVFRVVVCAVASITLAGPLTGLGGLPALAALFGLPPPPTLDPALHNHVRAISVMFACAGAMLAWSVFAIDAGKTVFRIGTAAVLVAGVARLTGWWVDGYPGLAPVGLMAIELVGFPLLLAWHTRILAARRISGSQ